VSKVQFGGGNERLSAVFLKRKTGRVVLVQGWERTMVKSLQGTAKRKGCSDEKGGPRITAKRGKLARKKKSWDDPRGKVCVPAAKQGAKLAQLKGGGSKGSTGWESVGT